MASPSWDGTVWLWNVETGEWPRTVAHSHAVYAVAFDPNGRLMASGDQAGTLLLSDTVTGDIVHKIERVGEGLISAAFDLTGSILATGGSGGGVALWDVSKGRLLERLTGHEGWVTDVRFDPNGEGLASASHDRTVRVWNLRTRKLLSVLKGHGGWIRSVAYQPGRRVLATSSRDGTVMLWDPDQGTLLRTLEGHTSDVTSIAFLHDGRILASKGSEPDHTIRLWRTDDWSSLAVIPEPATTQESPGLAFHRHLPLLAAVARDEASSDARDRAIRVYELDVAALLSQATEPSAHYVNAKVVLVGDTGVGKSGLGLVLNGQPFAATDSTPGRRVWTLDTKDVRVDARVMQTRETLLWDLAGQPGYRIIHQLHLNEVVVALVVFDARSEVDPLAGVRHWERALRLAQQRQRFAGLPMRKYLVSARNDRGGVAIGEERLQATLKEYEFDGYFKTSAKEGWQISELRAAIEGAIDWDGLPEVSSTRLFAEIKAFLLEVKESGRLLASAGELYDELGHRRPSGTSGEPNLRDQFETCIGRLENRDLIRRLSFGDYVLLQPELLDTCGSAMVNAAREEPDGLGSLAEDMALTGRFFVPKEQVIANPGQRQLLLHATVEELVRHDLALRENADDGRYLVFPSQFNRDFEDASEPKGKAAAITFDGPVQSLYATLAVRLGHSGLFTVGRAEMWRNAAVFTAKLGGRCGLYLQEFAEGRGRLILFFDDNASAETRFHFEEFVLAHARRRALDGSIVLTRFFVCPQCETPVPDAYVTMLRAQGQHVFRCPCPGRGEVPLDEPKERIHFRSAVEGMDRSADRQRDFDAFLMSAKGETTTRSFLQWAGGERVTLAIVFTDVVGSTAIGEDIKDEAMNEVRRAHFAQSRKLIQQFAGREIKTIGDSFMAAFRSVDTALDYAQALHREGGHPMVRIRAGIHIGPMQVEEADVFGGTVNFAARVVGMIKEAEVWISDQAKQDIDRLGANKHKDLRWDPQAGVPMKGFPGEFTVWRLQP